MRTTWLMVASAALACTAPADPDPAAVRLAALTAAAAADSIDDLQAVDDPDAAGVRDAFHNATREALVAASQARDSAPASTAAAFAGSLEAAEAAERLGDALVLALEARDDYAAARDHFTHAATKLADARADAQIGRDLRALEAADAALAQARSRQAEASDARRTAAGAHRERWERRQLLGGRRASELSRDRDRRARDALDRADDALDRARDAVWAANEERGRLVLRLRATAAAGSAKQPTLHQVERRFGEKTPTPQEVEGLEAKAASLADPAVEAKIAERAAADRAKQAMEAAEARVDEAITAYRVAVDAWRTLLE